MLLRLGRWADLKASVNMGVFGFMLPMFNIASEVGHGAVVASLAGFAIIKEAVLNVSPGNVLILDAIAMNILSGITGSSSSGLSIALEALGGGPVHGTAGRHQPPRCCTAWLCSRSTAWTRSAALRGIITLLAICKLTHRQPYLNIAAVTMAFPVTALVVVNHAGQSVGSF